MKRTGCVVRVLAALLLIAPCLLGSQEWTAYGGDAGGTRYSPLKQINVSNVKDLKVAWEFHTGDVSDGTQLPAHSSFETTPLVVNGVMYLSTPFSRVIALDPETGKQIWAFDPKIDTEVTVPLFVSRGVAWWTDDKSSRIFLGTLDGRLFSLDPKTGKPDAAFGKGGFVDLRIGVAEDFPDKHLGMTSPPAVYKDVVICGSITADELPQGPRGDIRGFDAHTGKLLWTFHSAARPDEFGGDTWEAQSAKDRAAVNAWSLLSVDVKRGIEISGQPGQQQVEDVVVRSKAQREPQHLAFAEQLPQGAGRLIIRLHARSTIHDVAAFQIGKSGVLIRSAVHPPEVHEVSQADGTRHGESPAPSGPEQDQADEGDTDDGRQLGGGIEQCRR